VTTRLQPCARLGLAHFVSTLAVCGVAAFVLPPAACAAPAAVDVSAIARGAAPTQTSSEHDWTSVAIAPDVPESSDDDDGDDAPGSTSALAAVSHVRLASLGPTGRVVHVPVVSMASHVMDGHALRGPPLVDYDSSDLDVDDDDDDDDAASEFTPLGSTSVLRALAIFHFRFEPAFSRATDTQSLRAP
jgi:hypothetical protein